MEKHNYLKKSLFFHVLSKVPSQRGGPSGLQYVPWGPWQCLLLWDWRIVWADPRAQRGIVKLQLSNGSQIKQSNQIYILILILWVILLSMENIYPKWEGWYVNKALQSISMINQVFLLFLGRWLSCLWPTLSFSKEWGSSPLKAVCSMGHQVSRSEKSLNDKAAISIRVYDKLRSIEFVKIHFEKHLFCIVYLTEVL